MGMGFICRQPNGKLCRFSHITESLTHINFTEEDYLNGDINDNMDLESKKDTLKNYIHPISRAIEKISFINYTKQELLQVLSDIGFPKCIAQYISQNLIRFKGTDIECRLCICSMCDNNCSYPCNSCEFDEVFEPILNCKEFIRRSEDG